LPWPNAVRVKDVEGLLLLAGHSFPRAAAGPSVGAGALSANGKAHAMATATKATNVLQALQGHAFLPAQVTELPTHLNDYKRLCEQKVD
jgi:hypothetical protein